MPFHTPPSAEVAGYAGFALFEALSDLLIIKDVLTRNEVDELLARTASRLLWDRVRPRYGSRISNVIPSNGGDARRSLKRFALASSISLSESGGDVGPKVRV